MTITSRLDFGSGTAADLAHQWDTKRKLFRLLEVCTLPSAILVTCATEGGRRLCFQHCPFVNMISQKLWMDSDKISWSGWMCDKDQMVILC